MTKKRDSRRPIELFYEGESLFARVNGEEEVEVKLLYARPVSRRGSQISIFDRDKRVELAWLESLDELDPKSREVAENALHSRYQISRIESVEHAFVNHGHRYLKVQTNRGFRYFNLKEPGKNVTWISDDSLLIRDSMGNRYEVPSLEKLDPESRARLELVL